MFSQKIMLILNSFLEVEKKIAKLTQDNLFHYQQKIKKYISMR